MKFRNITSVRSVLFTGESILPLRESSEFYGLREVLSKIADSKSFDILLSPEEEKLIKTILEKNDNYRKRNLSNIQKEIRRDKPKEYRDAILKARKEKVKQAWSNAKKKVEFFEDIKINDNGVEIKPKKLDGSPKSLSEIMNHNATLQ